MNRRWIALGGLACSLGCDLVTGVDHFQVRPPSAGGSGGSCDDCIEVLWAHAYGLGGHSSGRAVQADAVGNVIVAGEANAPIDFGAGPIPVTMGHDVVVAKLSTAGEHQWSAALSGREDQRALSLAVQPDGDAILGGTFDDSITFGRETLASPGNDDFDGFVALLAGSDGEPSWHTQLGGPNPQQVEALALSENGVWIAGSFFDGIYVPPRPDPWAYASAPGAYDAFVGRLDATGAVTWLLGYGDPQDDRGRAIAVDSTGHGIAGIQFRGGITVGEALVAADQDVVLAKLAPGDGSPVWAVQLGGVGDVFIDGLAVGPDDTVAMLGRFTGTLELAGAEPQSELGGETGVLLRLTSGGQPLVLRTFPNLVDPRASGGAVAFDRDGNLLLCGAFRGQTSFGGELLRSVETPGSGPSEDLFVAALDPSGEHLWSVAFGSIGRDTATAVAGDPSRRVLVTGEFESQMAVGDQLLTSVGEANMFVMKLAPGRSIDP